MPPTPIRTRKLPAETVELAEPVLPTIVVGSYKGGVWKTSIAVALAERLAWAGLSVMLLTTDDQEDARARLGLDGEQSPRLTRGTGTIMVVGAKGAVATGLIYRNGISRLNMTFDVIVVDTPPVEIGGHLPGVMMVATIDGADAARNLITMLENTPTNTDVVLVKVHRIDQDEWARDVTTIAKVLNRDRLRYLPEPLPKANPVVTAHNRGRSVWELPRRGCTKEFLDGIETLASTAWARIRPNETIPQMPSVKSSVYIPGWDDENDA